MWSPTGFGTRVEDLAWIDEFAASIRPYVRVRLEDGVLIRVPTDVHRLNPEGLALLSRALKGEEIAAIAADVGAAGRPERIHSIHAFFCDLRDLVSGHLGDGSGRLATRVSRFTGSFTKYPVLSELALTYKCNLACSFCYAGCGTPGATPGNAANEKGPRGLRARRPERDPVKDEMTTEEALLVLDAIAGEGKVPSVSFTGGECTLRPDLPRLIARAKRRGMRVNIITNGVRCGSPRYVAELREAGLDSAQVSIEGPTAKLHDGLTRRPGSFARAIAGIENLRDAGLTVHTHTTLSAGNAESAPAMADLAAHLGLARLSMNMIIPTGTPRLPENSGLRLAYEKIGERVLAVKARAAAARVRFHWYSPTPFCLFNPIAHGLGNKGCAACDGLLHVSPSGEVLPCSSFARGVGNLLEDGFDAVWFGEGARWYREKKMAPLLCRACEHLPLCQGACTLYWSGMGRGELRRAFARMQLDRVRSAVTRRRTC